MKGQRFLQTAFWADFKSNHGWTDFFFRKSPDGSLERLESYGTDVPTDERLTVLVRRVKFFNIAYIPMAPEFKDRNPDEAVQESDAAEYFGTLESLTASLRKYLPPRTLFVRYDVPVDFTDLSLKDDFVRFTSKGKGYRKSRVDIQPPDTVILPLDRTEEELLQDMKSKWRYNIRLAAKKGVEVTRYTGDSPDFDSAFDSFYELFEQTSKRDGVSFHAKSYYRDLLKRNSGSDVKISLYLARHEGESLAGIITLFCPREAVYLYGASGNAKRNLMPAYLLQWTAIRDAKEFGCPTYDFYGCPPTDDENHPMHGLFLFKTGFGGRLIHRPGSYDFSLSALYGLYEAAEKFRAWWFKVAMKKMHGR
ncbi:MAG: peptidoglycan bridge formation glycyltransferase FemA/FemB family protein [Treponema sp.]|nr:peptidoglycan bridge formation glycyltransferase FemA/FemB family protein [Treponema sp.]